MRGSILVTGGAGFIGSHTVVELVRAGYRPIIVDNFSNSERQVLNGLKDILGQEVMCYDHNFNDAFFLTDVVLKEKVEGVIHFAAYKAVGESVMFPLKYYENNVGGLVTLLKVMEKTHIKQLVFSSSCSVYGEPDSLPITEDAPVKPAVSPYGTTKQMAETIIKDAAKASEQLRALCLRYFNPIGAHESVKIGELPLGAPSNLVPVVCQAAAGLRESVTVFGNDYPTPDGSCIRDYIHVVDLARAHVKALATLDNQDTGYYEVCNVGTGQGHSVLEIIKTFEKVNKVKVPYTLGPRRPGDIVNIYASPEKAKTLLGWQAEKTLEEALASAWRWQQTKP